jgi:hypothetical protein
MQAPSGDRAKRLYESLRAKEAAQKESIQWRLISTEQHRDRRTLIRWMSNTCARAELSDVTLHSAVSIFDCYTERTDAVGERVYRLPALTSIVIAGFCRTPRQTAALQSEFRIP